MYLGAEGCEWAASGSERGSVLLGGNHSCKPPTHGTVLSDCQATLLYCICFLIQFIISGKLNYLCIYSFVIYLYVVALCVLTLSSWTFRSHLFFSYVPVDLMTEWSRKCYSRCIRDSCVWPWLFTPVVNRHKKTFWQHKRYLHNRGLIPLQTLCKSRSCSQRLT